MRGGEVMQKMSVAFVSKNLTLGSSIHRGKYPAALMRASWIRCEESSGRYDAIVHVKEVCPKVFHMSQRHVYDHVDNEFKQWWKFLLHSNLFHAEIFNTAEHMWWCVTKKCEVIPHMFQGGVFELNRSATPTIVGMVGWTKPKESEAYWSREFKTTVVREPMERDQQRSFFNNLRVGIAWNTGNPIYQPCERFTNLVMLNIPVIGYYYQSCQRKYGTDFLCKDSVCVQKMIATLTKGGMQRQFRTLRENVRKDVHPRRIFRLYNRVLKD